MEFDEEGKPFDLGPAVDPIDQRVVPFMGKEAQAARVEGLGIYVTVKSLCAMIGIRYERQYDRIRRTKTLVRHSRLIRMQTKGGFQPMLCLKVNRVAFWISTVQTSGIKDERIREIIEALQEDFADVANEVFLRHLGNEATALVPLPDDPQIQALAAQYNHLVGVVNLMREHLEEVALTVSPLPEKMDQIAQLLQQLFASQQTQDQQIAQIDERTKRLSPAHARTIQEFVNDMVRQTSHLPLPLDHYKIYGALKQRFRAPSYKEIADEQFEAIMYFLREELRRALSGELPEQGRLF